MTRYQVLCECGAFWHSTRIALPVAEAVSLGERLRSLGLRVKYTRAA